MNLPDWLDKLDKLADEYPTQGGGSYLDHINKDWIQTIKAMIEVVRAANHFTDPKTQCLQVTALCAYDDLKEALTKLEGLYEETM